MVTVQSNDTKEPTEVPRRKGFGGGLRRPRDGADATRGGADDGARLDMRNSWQVIAGSILIPLGVVFILLAWYGAAHARVEQQQIPYMVSGSFAGLGCMVVGGLLYWGHWLYRMYDQAELHHEEQQQLMLELMRTIVATSSNGATAGGSVGSLSAAGTVEATYLATTSGSVYHRADCAVIAHHPNDVRSLAASALGGLRPCQICSPDRPDSPDRPV